MSQGIYWLLTIPHADFLPYQPDDVQYIKGQLEQGAEGGYLHWQVLVAFKSKCRLANVKRVFGQTAHCELSKSKAANDYVWKEDTRVEGTQFELGKLAFKRNNQTDWESVKDLAKRGRVDDVPGDVYVRYYGNLKRIHQDNLVPVGMEREVVCYWGDTGAGKSRRAWDEAGLDAFPKDPRCKFWDGYRGHKHVVMDEFRGAIDVSHMLRWCDRYPVIIEIKGSSTVLAAEKIWITSNIHPREWYPGLDEATLGALLRRITVVHFVIPFQ